MKHIALILAAAAISFSTAQAAEPSDSILQEVVITGTRSATDVRHLSQTVNVVDRFAIQETNRSSLLPLLTEQVPGLFVTQRGYAGYGVSGGAAGNISMRGMSGSSARMLILIDGHPNYAGIYGHPIADSYQSLMTERVEVLRGPASLLYGSDAMAGVINIVTKKPQDGTHAYVHAGYGSFNTAESEFSVNTRQGKLSAVASGSYNRTDGHRDNMNFEQFGGYAKVGYDISKNWNASANVDITRFKASQPGSESAPLIDADQDITRGTTALFIENNYSNTSGAVSVFYNWGNHWINDGYTPGTTTKAYRFVSYDEMWGASAWQSASLFEGNRLTLGFDYYRYGGKANNHYVDGPNAGTDELQVDASEDEIAGYLETRQTIGDWLTLNAGLRVDHHSKAGTELVPQAGAAFHLPANAEVKLSVGKGFRYPIIREMFMYPPQNADLKAESLWNYELAFSQTLLDGKFNYGVNLFYLDAENIILQNGVFNPDGTPFLMPNGRQKQLNMNSGELKNKGVELQASYLVSKSIAVHGNYSYLNMETPVIGAPENKVYLGGSYTNNGLHVSTGLQYINGLYSIVNTDDPSKSKKENFLLWNARVSYQITDMVQVWVNGDNLLNTKYQINDGYPMPGIAFMAGVNLSF